jgi:hypothetical protein
VIRILFTDIPGWIGAVLILIAFWLLTHRVVHSHSYPYLGLNLVAGILLGYDAWVHRTYAGLSINIAWVLIALYGLGWAHKRKPPVLKR